MKYIVDIRFSKVKYILGRHLGAEILSLFTVKAVAHRLTYRHLPSITGKYTVSEAICM